MKSTVKLGIFAAALALAFGGAFGVGVVLDADRAGGPDRADTQTVSQEMAGSASLPGLAVSDRGYTLRLLDSTPGAGETVPLSFAIAGPDGAAVQDYMPTHEKEMHLIVVRRDLGAFQHLHPERAADGTWSALADLRAAGTYRVFADFAPAALDGKVLTLGADIFVPGEFAPADLAEPATTWAADGYEVTLGGAPIPGSESELTFDVRRDGTPIDLEPYLGAFGHLVALRSGDLAYLHTHPAREAAVGDLGGPQVRFGITFPTAGRYRLHLNFAHAGIVHTAEFTVEIPHGQTTAAPPSDQPAAPEQHTPPAGHGGH